MLLKHICARILTVSGNIWTWLRPIDRSLVRQSNWFLSWSTGKGYSLIADSIFDVLALKNVLNIFRSSFKFDIRVDDSPNKSNNFLHRVVLEQAAQNADQIDNMLARLRLLDEDGDVLFNSFDVILQDLEVRQVREKADEEFSIDDFSFLFGFLQEERELLALHFVYFMQEYI